MGGVGLLLLPPFTLSVSVCLCWHVLPRLSVDLLEILLRKVEDERGNLTRPRNNLFWARTDGVGGGWPASYGSLGLFGNFVLRHNGKLSGFRQLPVFARRPHMPASYPES